ncbi:MAG: hypothetical protein IKO36_00530 [Bacteroidaceae bacterium]|nr:hypothetical protein [Bacteroidaceae bacterium]
MKFEDFIRSSLSDRKISIKDAAIMLGYTEPSFRNKLSKGNLNLRDVIILSILLDLHLSLYDDFGNSLYSFDISDYLSEDDLLRLKTFMETKMNDQKYLAWFKALPDEQKQAIYEMVQAKQIKPKSDRGKKKLIKVIGKNEGFSLLQGIKKRYFIFGSDHDEAYKYIMAQISDNPHSQEDETIEERIIEDAIQRFSVEIKSDITP